VAPKLKASPAGLYFTIFPTSRNAFLFLPLNRLTRFSDHLNPLDEWIIEYRASMRHWWT